MSEDELRDFMTRYAAAETEEERMRLENEAKGRRKMENDESERIIKEMFKKCPQCSTDIDVRSTDFVYKNGENMKNNFFTENNGM